MNPPEHSFPERRIAGVQHDRRQRRKIFGVGAKYAIGAGVVFANWTHTKFEPIVGGDSKLNNYEIGGKYNFTTALNAGLGYTFSDLDGATDGRWHQMNASVDYARSKRIDVYVIGAFQKASGQNIVAGRVVPVQAQIGSSTSYVGVASADTQVAARVGIRHRF